MSAKDIAPYKGKRRNLIETLADAGNADLGIEETCRMAKISKPLYYKYIGEPEFQSALKAIVTRNYARFAPQVGNSVIKQAKKGNMKAADLIHRVLGYVDTGNNQTVNIANAIQDDKPMEFPDTSVGRADALAYIAIIRKQCDDEEIRINTQARQAGDAIHRQPDSPGHEEA